MEYLLLNSLGLALDIIGVSLLFWFGLPSKVRKGGVSFLALEEPNAEEVKQFKRYQLGAHIGLGLLIFGFALQIISNLMQFQTLGNR